MEPSKLGKGTIRRRMVGAKNIITDVRSSPRMKGLFDLLYRRDSALLADDLKEAAFNTALILSLYVGSNGLIRFDKGEDIIKSVIEETSEDLQYSDQMKEAFSMLEEDIKDVLETGDNSNASTV